jgi:hypothetical protein
MSQERVTSRLGSVVSLNEVQVIRAAATASGGWIYATSGGSSAGLYRYQDDSSLTETSTLPVYRSPFSTTLGGQVYIGGVRCRTDACTSWIAEVNRFTSDGKLAGTSTLDQGSTSPDETTSIGLIGLEPDDLVIDLGQRLVRLGANGDAAQVSDSADHGQVCSIGGSLYEIDYPNEPPSAPREIPAAGAPQTRSIAISPLGTQAQPSATSTMTFPSPLNFYCASQTIAAVSGDITQAIWTPSDGWKAVTPDAASSDPAFATASTGAIYGLGADGLLQARGPSAINRSLQFLKPAANSIPAVIQVDDSGGALFACVTESTASALENDSQQTTSTSCQFTNG